MLTMLKDLFWKDQFNPDGTEPYRLDRDRYFIVLMLLFSFQLVANAGGQFIFPPYSGDLYENIMEYWGVLQGFYDIYFAAGPLLLIINLVVAWRVVPFWLLFIPLGLLNYSMQNAVRMLTYMMGTDISTPDDVVVVAVGCVMLLWVVIHIGLLFMPKLSASQPHHPLLKLNPAFAPDQQLNAIQFMWRTAILSAIVGVVAGGAVAFIILVTAFGGRLNSSEIQTVAVFAALLALVSGAVMLWFAVQRLRNMGWNRWKVILLWALPVAVFFAAQAGVYSQSFFDSKLVYLGFFLLLPWVRLANMLLQVAMICWPAQENCEAVMVTEAETGVATDATIGAATGVTSSSDGSAPEPLSESAQTLQKDT